MNKFKVMTLAIISAAILSAASLLPTTASTAADEFDGAATYKAKCVACHGQKAEKKFNTDLTDQELIDAVLNGKKAEKPPNMPAYGEKGITAEQAKALVEHMKGLKNAP